MTELAEVVEACITRRLRGLHTACLGTFVNYADSLATVQAQALDGVLPVPMQGVPVVLPGDWEAGDPCLLVFAEEEFSGELASTGSARRHGLFAVAVPLVARPGQTTDFVALSGLVEGLVGDVLDTVRSTIVLALNGLAPGTTAAWDAAVATLDTNVAAEKLRAR